MAKTCTYVWLMANNCKQKFKANISLCRILGHSKSKLYYDKFSVRIMILSLSKHNLLGVQIAHSRGDTD